MRSCSDHLLRIIVFASQTSGEDQLFMEFEPHGVVGVDQRAGQPDRVAAMDVVQCGLQFRRVKVQPGELVDRAATIGVTRWCTSSSRASTAASWPGRGVCWADRP